MRANGRWHWLENESVRKGKETRTTKHFLTWIPFSPNLNYCNANALAKFQSLPKGREESWGGTHLLPPSRCRFIRAATPPPSTPDGGGGTLRRRRVPLPCTIATSASSSAGSHGWSPPSWWPTLSSSSSQCI